MYVYVMSLCLIGAYLSCSVYNFMWIVHPRVGLLSKFLDGCVRQKDSYTEKHSKMDLSSKKGPEIRLKLYFMVNYPMICIRKYSRLVVLCIKIRLKLCFISILSKVSILCVIKIGSR